MVDKRRRCGLPHLQCRFSGDETVMRQSAKAIMFLGTGSDVGKSITAAGLLPHTQTARLQCGPVQGPEHVQQLVYHCRGRRDRPGPGRSGRGRRSASIQRHESDPAQTFFGTGGSGRWIQGRVYGQMQAVDYHHHKKKLVAAVMESYHRLASRYEVIVLEGAGSCARGQPEVQRSGQFSPWPNAPGRPASWWPISTGGGVFAQIIGSMSLMTRREKELTAGFIINKFRGDPALFTDGIRINRTTDQETRIRSGAFFRGYFYRPGRFGRGSDRQTGLAGARPGSPERGRGPFARSVQFHGHGSPGTGAGRPVSTICSSRPIWNRTTC